MMLCAVFRAIFLPAALVAEGCLRFEFEVLACAAVAALPTVVALLEGGGAPADAANEVPGGT
jgi:hypothetical protein